MAKRIPYIPNRVIDTNGISDGATIDVFQTGTTTRVSIYSDEALTTPLANPYTVVAGAAVPAIYHGEGANIRVRVKQSDGTTISDDDPFEAPVTDVALASTAAGKGAALVAVEGGGTVQDIAFGTAIQKQVAADSDPLIIGETFGDLETAEASTYPNARFIRKSGLDIFVRPDLPDGALDAERYGIGDAQSHAENGARLTWLAARGYKKIVHRAAQLEASGIEVYDRQDVTFCFRNLHNPGTLGEPTFHLNKNAIGATDAVLRMRVEADLISNVDGAGHVFKVEGLLADCPALLAGCNEIDNRSVSAALFYFDPDATQPGRSTNNIFTGVWRTPQNATVPMMFQDNNDSTFNNNIVMPRQIFCPDAVPAIQLLNRRSDTYNNGNIFQLPLEYCIAGALHLTGQAAPQIRDVVQYDQTFYAAEYVADIIYVGRYDDYVARYPGYAARSYTGTPVSSHGVSVVGYKRDWNMTLGSWFDINIAAADEFFIDGVISTSDNALRTIGISLPSTTIEGTIGPNCKNIALTNFSPSKHITLNGSVAKFPDLQVGGVPANALGYASGDVSGVDGVLTNGNNITSVTKNGTGRYDVVLATDIGSTNYQVLVSLKETDGSHWVAKTSGTAFSIYTRSVGSTPAAADKALQFTVMVPS